MPKSLHAKFDTAEEALEALPSWIRSANMLARVPIQYTYHWKSIGAAVRARREESGMSLRSAAKWMSISPTYLSDLERGIRPWPPQRLMDMSNVLDMAERTKH